MRFKTQKTPRHMKPRQQQQQQQQLQKCPVCLVQLKQKNLDKHMHSCAHHEAIEKLMGSQQMHKCWACGVFILGLEQYGRHIMTPAHVTNLVNLQKNRCRGKGFIVDYTDGELTAICAERDQKRRVLKLQKKKERERRKKAKKVTQFRKEFNCSWLTKKKVHVNNYQITQSNQQSQPLYEEEAHGSNQTAGYMNNFYWQQFNMYCLGDDLSPSLGTMFSSPEENGDSSQQSRSANRKRLSADPPNSSPVKKPVKTDINGRYSSFSEGFETSGKPAQSLVHCRVNPCLSTMPQRMHQPVKKDQGLFVRFSANLDSSAANGVKELNKSTEEPKSKHVGNGNLRNSKLAKEKTATSSMLKNSLEKPSSGSQPAGGGSSKQCHKTKELEAKIKGKSSPPRMPSGGYKLADLLKETKTNQHKKKELTHSKHSLPALLNRSVSKTEASKPNLNVARGIRTSQRPNKTGSEPKVLKPALQKLISSKSSQWKVNWKEIYDEATKRKLQKEKGLPRFGIELLSPLTSGPLELDEVKDFALDEGFQWESISSDDVTPSSSVVPLSENTCGTQPAEASPGPSAERHNGETSVTKLTSQPMETPLMKSKTMERISIRGAITNVTSLSNRTSGPVTEAAGRKDAHTAEQAKALAPSFETQHGLMPGVSLINVKAEKLDDSKTEKTAEFKLIRHIKKEKQDAPDTSIVNVEIPKQKLSELLEAFQKEDELSISLEDVNSQLLLAQSALHAAISNIQNLQEIKQQVTAEMASLRSKRIKILQRIQNSSLCETSSAAFPNPATESLPEISRQQQDQVLDHPTIESL
ncbi:uncharacterized protein znf106b [Salminus brasiliensis]|uniref:uncharacterized protein znf106b n=1 Tax=Salminus brasiliensis TaxID=930266 RepID=UPI003B82E4C7